MGPARFVVLNTHYLWPAEGSREAPQGVTLLREDHPLQFLPYQYESFSSRERRLLRTTDISMRLIDTQPAPSAALDSSTPR
jgi:hypothetical protein